jgi:hypothetical protein
MSEREPLPIGRRLGALGLVYLATALPAVLAAAPFARAAARLVGHDPRGDALLFRPGGAWLVEAGRGAFELAPVALPLAPWVLAPWALALIVPWGFLLVALTTEGPLHRGGAGHVLLGRLGSLVSLTALSVITRGAALAIGAALALELGPSLAGANASVRTRELLTLAFALGAPLGYGVVRLVHDLALAACVRRREAAAPSIVTALGTLYRDFGRTVGPFLASIVVQGASIGLTAWAVGRLMGTPNEWPWVLVVHQLTLLALVVARAFWLRRALVLVGPPWPPPDDD